jgi:hypothetical protein
MSFLNDPGVEPGRFELDPVATVAAPSARPDPTAPEPPWVTSAEPAPSMAAPAAPASPTVRGMKRLGGALPLVAAVALISGLASSGATFAVTTAVSGSGQSAVASSSGAGGVTLSSTSGSLASAIATS